MTYPTGPYTYGYPPLPPPPKPGVIPLAPLGLSQILTGAFGTIGRSWKPLFGVAAVAYGAMLVLFAAAAGILFLVFADTFDMLSDLPPGEDPAWGDVSPLVISAIAVWLLFACGLFFATAMVYAVGPVVLQDAVLGRRTTFRAAWQRSLSRAPSVLGTIFLTVLIIMVPVAVLVAVGAGLAAVFAASDASPALAPLLVSVAFFLFLPFAAWLWGKFSLAPTVAVFERQGPVAAMRRSSELVRGAWWRVFGCTLLAAVIAGVISYLIQWVVTLLVMLPLLFGSGPASDGAGVATVVIVVLLVLVAMLLSQIVSYVFPPLVTGLVYVDQRIRKENLAPTLAQAAGAGPLSP